MTNSDGKSAFPCTICSCAFKNGLRTLSSLMSSCIKLSPDLEFTLLTFLIPWKLKQLLKAVSTKALE